MTHGTSTPQAQPSPVTEPWPAGVRTRYLTAGGARVDVRGSRDDASYKCWGCGDSTALYGERRTNELAQGHAKKCTALPRPHAAETTPWADGVIARYITVAGAALGRDDLAVVITYTSDSGWITATCAGCGHVDRTDTGGLLDDSPEKEAERVEENLPASRAQAQSHAEKCRALPRPAVA